MINIAICDDQDYDRKNLKQILEKISLRNNIRFNIEEFKSGKELLNIYKRDIPKFDVIFLDIILGDSNGIDVAKCILDLYPK